MDCNKDEALRARDLAESKMQNRDFLAARKIVLKAQQLYPDLENISQMLTVCEVHISAATKVNGEMDWYSILHVESTADEHAIKKQFRKLALLLHPDKNKFVGAEAAFKLIKEAHMILSDKGKRSLHDMKRGAKYFQARQPAPQGTRKQSGVAINVRTSSVHFNGFNQQQSSSSFTNSQTFWTLCPNCNTRYQYYKTILDKHIRCHSCLHPYVAHDMDVQPRNTGSGAGDSNNPAGAHYHVFPGQNAATAAAQHKFSGATAAAPNTGFQGNVGRGSSVRESTSKPRSANKTKEQVKFSKGGVGCGTKCEMSAPEDIHKRPKAKPPSSNDRRKRAKILDDESSIGSYDSGSSDSEDSITKRFNSAETSSWANGNSRPRRSARQKQHISYNEDKNGDEDDDDNNTGTYSNSGRSKADDLEGHVGHRNRYEGVVNGENVRLWKSAEVEDNKNVNDDKHLPEGNLPVGRATVDTKRVHGTEQRGMSEDKIPTCEPSTCTTEYPDPEFYDFDKNRDPKRFAVDQIWALYDDAGEMPRFYARIRSVSSPQFRVRYTWLEYDPTEEAESAWCERGLPVACGKYKLGKTDYSSNTIIFSHIMACKAGSKKNTYEIYPRKGEVWALFKDWDISWSSIAENHEPYNYELVEVLSDLTESSDIIVIQMQKVKGFVSLFTAAGKEASPLRIPRNEVLRFSHMVPSYKLSANEREGVPGGCFEIDAVSLPKNFGETCPSITLNSATMFFEGASSKAANCNEQAEATKSKKMELNKDEGEREEGNVGVIDLSPDRENVLSGKEYIEVRSDLHASTKAQTCLEDESVEHEVNLDATNYDRSEPEIYEYYYPESEFYDFEEERSVQKFARGQIWALYSDTNKYPNFYGLIKNVRRADFSVQLVWLEPCPLHEGESEWIKKQLPYGCGRFKVLQDSQTFDSTASFSHLVNATPSGRKERYDVYPKEGEIWAIFKKWRMQWTQADLDQSEYDVVEIIKQTGSSITYSALTRVYGYKTIFMPDEKRGSFGIVEVPVTERLRFSHQVPAFRLTEERGGKLRGFWELDPASVPELLVCTD